MKALSKGLYFLPMKTVWDFRFGKISLLLKIPVEKLRDKKLAVESRLSFGLGCRLLMGIFEQTNRYIGKVAEFKSSILGMRPLMKLSKDKCSFIFVKFLRLGMRFESQTSFLRYWETVFEQRVLGKTVFENFSKTIGYGS